MESETEQIKKRLSRKDNELRKLHEELEDTKKRLASSFERRLRRDQRRVESTGELNPPSAVEEDFKDFLGGERIDAWKKIETMLSPTEEIDVQIRYLACIIFVTAYEQVEEAKEAAYDLFKDVTRQLAFEAPRWSQELCLKRKFKTKDNNEDGYSPQFTVELKISVEKKSEDATDVIDGLMHSLKQTAHLCNLECFENDIKQRVWERWEKCRQQDKEKSLLPPLSEQVIPELDDYIKACIRLSWRLVTQVPPLHLEYNSSKFNRNMHNLTSLHFNTENSALHPSENIACYFSPALLERGGRVVCPAEVLCELTDSFSK